MENHHFQFENPLKMAIFNSYVSLPEGKYSQILLLKTPETYGTWAPGGTQRAKTVEKFQGTSLQTTRLLRRGDTSTQQLLEFVRG